MQLWLVIVLYVAWALLLIIFHYVLRIRWWSAIVFGVLITYIIILCIPEDIINYDSSSLNLAGVLFTILIILAPVLVIVYVIVQALMDRYPYQGFWNIPEKWCVLPARE